jgi:hypothetical protein
VKYCRLCITPDTRPNVVFDADGVCSACRNVATKPAIDWTERERQFREVVGTPAHATALAGFETHTATFVRNPVFKNPRLYLDDPRFRDHVYDHTA